MPEPEYLLSRNRIKIENAEIKRSELASYYRQKPNRRILGVYRFHLQVYNLADGFGENKFFRWMKNTIGEPPVIYDESLSQGTVRQFEMYMRSKGYFNSEVRAFERIYRRSAIITYAVTGNTPYTIRNISYNIADPAVLRIVEAERVNSLIKTGDKYDADKLDQERNRITRNLRNDGYFRFSRDFILFEVDSNLNAHQVNIQMRINSPTQPVAGRRDSVEVLRHRRFLINQVNVLPEFSPLTSQVPRNDTTIFSVQSKKPDVSRDFLFLHHGPLRIKPRVIVNHLMVRPGNYFRQTDVEQTYTFLSELRNFRFINLQLQETHASVWAEPSDTLGFLNTVVQLNRSAANAFTIEAEGLNTAGNLGVASNLLYQNRNVLRGAEIFNLRLKGALEVSGETTSEEVINRLPFNTLELGAEIGIDFPKLLLPIAIDLLSRNSRPKSSITAGVNFRQRPDYTRYVLNLNYGFEWNETPRKRHFINPIDISSVRVYNDSILRASIPDANPFILSRFRDHFILGLKYTYVYNTQVVGRVSDFEYLRTNFESAGNLLSLAANGLNLTMDENGSYNVFSIPFSQYIKADADYRYYKVFVASQSLVFRIMGGVGMPYGNVNVLPFIKSYYGGGANGLRAWKIYTLGPGGYVGSDQVRFDRYGDIKLETNLEYRFRFYSFWHGAFFLDAGNVWFVKSNDRFPGGEFRLDKLHQDIAIGAGFGLRLDFDFFILRIDVATPVKDPSERGRLQWIQGWPALRDYNFNLGIGYPF